MPCGCFGKKKAAVEQPEKVPPSEIKYSPSSDAKGIRAGDTKNNRKDVVTSDSKEECALLSSHPAGSPNSNIDSPTSNSHTPSTVPAVASSASSQASSSVASSPADSRIVAAYSRSQLAQKRREFFIELYPVEKGGTARYYQTSPSTLPTIARAKQFGKVRSVRPVSQPSSPVDPPVPDAPPIPGPHLLHHRAESPRDSTKIDAKGSGLSSEEFLLELKSASDQISKRWAMAEVDVPEYTSYALKMDAVEYNADKYTEEGAAIDIASSNASHSASPRSPPNSPALSDPSQSSGVPETLITPPSPLSPQEALLSQLDSQSPYSGVVSGAKEDLRHSEEEEYYVQDEFRIQEEYQRSYNPLEEEEYIEEEEDLQEDFDLMTKRISDIGNDSFDLSDQPTTDGYPPLYTEPVTEYERKTEKQPLVDLEPTDIPTEPAILKQQPSDNDSPLVDQDPAIDHRSRDQPILDLEQEQLLRDEFDNKNLPVSN